MYAQRSRHDDEEDGEETFDPALGVAAAVKALSGELLQRQRARRDGEDLAAIDEARLGPDEHERGAERMKLYVPLAGWGGADGSVVPVRMSESESPFRPLILLDGEENEDGIGCCAARTGEPHSFSHAAAARADPPLLLDSTALPLPLPLPVRFGRAKIESSNKVESGSQQQEKTRARTSAWPSQHRRGPTALRSPPFPPFSAFAALAIHCKRSVILYTTFCNCQVVVVVKACATSSMVATVCLVMISLELLLLEGAAAQAEHSAQAQRQKGLQRSPGQDDRGPSRRAKRSTRGVASNTARASPSSDEEGHARNEWV